MFSNTLCRSTWQLLFIGLKKYRLRKI